MSDSIEFTDLYQEYRGAMVPGKLKLNPTGLVYKNSKNGKVEQHKKTDLAEATWIRRAKGKCLRIVNKDDFVYMFDGFKESDFGRMAEHFKKHYELDLEKKERCFKGWNWGHYKFHGNSMEFQVDGSTSLEIPLANVSQSRQSKNEVTLEFHPNEDAPISVVEATFYNLTVTAAEEFHNNITTRAEEQATGDAITIFNEIQCLTPRGRYDIKIFPSFLQLHGKTFDYKILYRSIVRLFLLPHKDNRQYYFMVGLDPPIRQGQTRYHFLIFLFSKDLELTLDMSMSEEDLEAKYDGKLKKEMVGPEHEVISQVVRVLVDKKITCPGSYKGHNGSQSIGCSYKAATGFLYPLEKGFAYVHKPPLYVKFEDVGSVNFGRSAGSTRSFDFDVETKSGVSYNFVGIEKEEYGHLHEFVKKKNLRVKNVDKNESRKVPKYREEDDSDDGDRVHKAYMERMKHEGKGRDADDDDDDESDESFKPDASESEPDDEYDSNHESSGSENEMEPKKKKPRLDSEKMEVDDVDDDDDEGNDEKKEKKDKKKKKKDDDDDDGGNDEMKEKKDKKKKDEEEEDGDHDDDDEEEERKEKKKSKPKKAKEPKKSGEKRKKERDANKPKKSRTAFMVWLSEAREKIKAEFPSFTMIEITKKAGERWRELKDKSKWEKIASKEKAAYDEAMVQYKKDGGSTSNNSNNKDVKKSKLGKTDSSQSSGFKSKEFISDDDSNDDKDDASEMSD